ncbi:MAG: hypothetical protein ACT4O5_08730 [Gammaproteobacteria bacterium]
MRRLWLAKVGRTLIPADYDAEQQIARMGDGEVAEYSVIQPRSVPMHRRWFGICRVIGDNQEPKRDEKSICNELKVLAGHFDVLPIAGAEGYQVRVPKSIAFDKLTHDEWMALWPSLERAGIDRFGETYFLVAA